MAMSQEALTFAVQQLQVQVQSLATELNTIVPTFTMRIDDEIKRTQETVDSVNDRITAIDSKLKIELNPLISMSEATKIQQLMDFTQKVP